MTPLHNPGPKKGG